MQKQKVSKRQLTYKALRVLMALGIAFFICQINLDYLESLSYDYRIRWKPKTAPSGNIITIAINPETQEELKRHPNAKDHLQLLNYVGQGNPKAIVYVIDSSDISGSYEELEKLAGVMKNLPFYMAIEDRLPVKGLEDEFKLLPPLQDVKVAAAPKTIDSNSFAKDKVTRRYVFSFQGRPLLHTQLASLYNNKVNPSDYHGVFKYKRTHQGYIDFHPTGTYKPVSFLDVLNGETDSSVFENKIVILGRDTKSDLDDYIMTPLSRDILAMSKLEMHANIFDTLILNKGYISAPSWLNLIITSLISLFTVFVVLALRPTKGLLLLVGTISAFSLTSYGIMSLFHVWIGMSHPFIAVFICYYFFIPYRLIMENRKSWEYYQRNTLLTQVEELKSNFLRMMSHDLKTPLARIQGMVDIVKNDVNDLSPNQDKALETIRSSSEELTSFIGSILNLGRIESKEIKLQLKSRDLNELLSEVVKKCEYLAQEKNIVVITELEPIFSIRIDSDLLRQVFTNLVENAIKYSEPNTKVLITSEEENGQLIVQVADQGIGIPKEELENIFTKFYRSNTVKNTDIKGSGLGLYLSSYFVALHKGRISVDSEYQRGSTFTVELPMDLH